MSELIQVLSLAKDAELSTRVSNLILVAQAHDSEIQQLRTTVNQLIDAGKSTSLANVILAWVGLAVFVATIIVFGWYMTKMERRIKALEAQKS